MSTEIEPFIVYRFVGPNVEFAMWKVNQADNALALFQSAEAAEAYRKAASLGDEWRVLHPTRQALVELLRATHEAGVRYAVLDPDLEKARTLFDIASVLRAASGAEPH